MTMNVVLGSGEMPVRELTASLQDLWNEALANEDNFWFLIQAKSEPTATDKALVAWLSSNDVWFSVVSDGTDVDPIYLAEAQEQHTAKRLAPTVVQLMRTGPEEDEAAQLLALFASDDFSAEEDRWLNDVGAVVQEAGFTVRALNDGLIEVDMLDTPEEEGEGAGGVELPAGIEAALAAEEAEEKALDEMGREDLIAHAAEMGLTFPPRTRMNTMIQAILARAKEDGEVPTEERVDRAGWSQMATVSSLPDQNFIGGPAMMILIVGGVVTAKIITPEQADALITASA